jgi:acyl transferase domain-containing protein/acyl carrier protein
MFPGQGTQYVGLARGLYRSEPVFREYIDLCAEQLSAHLNLDLRDVLYPNEEGEAEATRLLGQTFVTQPALFCIEYALAQLWMSWGVVPAAMIGHSVGEYVAACLANVFSLEDALALVAVRGQLMQQLPSGAMLAVMLSETETRSLLHDGLALAAVNGAKNCVVSGTSTAIQALHDRLKQQDVHSQVLHTSHAFHSEMMEPILEPFTDRVRQVKLNAPAIPFLSNVTGAWQNDRQATDPAYWSRHLRQTVRFADGLGNLLQDAERILLEVGPGHTLNALAKQRTSQTGNQVVLSSLPRARDGHTDAEFLLNSVGQFWLAGGQIDWERFYAGEQRRRIPLPTYPFERQRYYLEPVSGPTLSEKHRRPSSEKRADIADWFYLPSWKQFDLPRRAKSDREDHSWVIFCDESGVGEALVQQLRQRGKEIVVVHAGERFRRIDEHVYTLNPAERRDYDALVQEWETRGIKSTKVIHLWSLDNAASFEQAQQSGLHSLLFLTQALADRSLTNALELVVVTDSVQEVSGDESLRPERSTVLGACKVIPQEYPEMTCRSIDVTRDTALTRIVDQLADELTEKGLERVVAYRGRHRWVQSFEPVRLEKGTGSQSLLDDGGVYLITGGLGVVGLALAQHLARIHKAKLALLGRSSLPEARVKEVRELEAMGAEVLLLRADVANEEQMFEAVARTVERFGRIDGVIYGAAAGAGTDKEIRETTPADCTVQFQAKAQGLLVLEKVLQGRDYKFCLMLSSLSSILGGITFAAYAAANNFVDTFVRKVNQSYQAPWISVNWDAWNDSAIDSNSGGEALERVLSIGPVSQIAVSISDLDARLERWVSFENSQTTLTVEKSEIAVLHPRPNLLNAYVAPSNELEQDLAETWAVLLGIEQVGIDDNFFELGGHSLLATMVLSRLRKEFDVELPLRSFFESPTVSGLALVIAQRVIENQDEQSIAQLLEGASK